MNLHDLDPLSNVDAAEFGRILLRWIAGRGAAVLALDHVAKASDDRGRYALGAVHKLNAVDGAAFIIENRRPIGIGLTGTSTVLLAKDRPGQLRQHAKPSSAGLYWYANLAMKSHDVAFVEIELTAPPEQTPDFRPTALMTKIANVLSTAAKPLSQNEIVIRVGSKRSMTVRQALAFLVDDSFVKVEAGPNRSQLHTLIKPYEPAGAQMELPELREDEPPEEDNNHA